LSTMSSNSVEYKILLGVEYLSQQSQLKIKL
jgi:hypothetical protein